MIYRERLTVPWTWWLIAALFASSVLLALGYYLGAAWGLGSGLVTLGLAAALFASASTLLTVHPDRLQIGRSVIDAPYVGAVRTLDSAQTRRRSETEADARAHLVLRPYVTASVEIILDDPHDPVPYWLVSSRRPAAFAAALTQLLDPPIGPAAGSGA